MGRGLTLLLLFAFIAGCATGVGGFGSVSKTNQLAPGMTPDEVKAVLGDPSQTQFIADKWIWKYSLQQPWKGYIPYYMVFTGKPAVLQEWLADEDEYMRQQKLWLEQFPPTQKYEVDVQVR